MTTTAPATRTRSEERTEFITDVFTTALEGGINYWAVVTEYQHDGDYPHATIVDAEAHYQDEITPETTWHVDLDTIAKGLNRITKAKAGEIEYLHEGHRRLVAAANRANDCAPDGHNDDIDADVADNILQVALFGKVVYG